MSEMYTITRILTPVDGSEYSRYAAQYAIRLAHAHGAEIVFLHVVDEQLVNELAHWDGDVGAGRTRSRLAENGRVYLDAVAEMAGASGVAHREEMRDGDPCAVICEVAGEFHPELIVVGKIGHHGARRLLMGSITRRLIESTDRPVLVVTGPLAALQKERGECVDPRAEPASGE
jgi:nucleotide-binding universal stress UspA family protein